MYDCFPYLVYIWFKKASCGRQHLNTNICPDISFVSWCSPNMDATGEYVINAGRGACFGDFATVWTARTCILVLESSFCSPSQLMQQTRRLSWLFDLHLDIGDIGSVHLDASRMHHRHTAMSQLIKSIRQEHILLLNPKIQHIRVSSTFLQWTKFNPQSWQQLCFLMRDNWFFQLRESKRKSLHLFFSLWNISSCLLV